MEELRQALMGDCFFRQEELTFRDCDARGRARPGTLLSLLAITAGHDFDARDLNYLRLYELRQVFLLSRIALCIHRHPIAGEVLTITTWENGAKAAHVRRGYEMEDTAGRSCVSARSEWIIVDPDSRRILRPAQFTAERIHCCTRQIDCPECRKILLPEDGLTELGEHTVAYSDLDYNGHVFSGRYGDILWDALPPELQEAELGELQINYSREATLGEKLRIAAVRQGDTLLAGGACGGEHCFTCACTFRQREAYGTSE